MVACLTLVVVCGLPGAGKSTIAERLTATLGLPTFSVDPIEAAILEAGLARSFETGLAAYMVAAALAGEHLRLGHSAIVDAVSAVREARDLWRDLADRYTARLAVIECICPPELHRARVEARVRRLPGIPEVRWADVEARRQEYLPWRASRLVLDTSAGLEDNVRRAIAYLSTVE